MQTKGIKGKPISQQKISEVWHSITDKELPKVNAYVLTFKHYQKAMKRLSERPNVIPHTVKEYGVKFPPTETRAIVINLDSKCSEFLILISQGGRINIEAKLKHELQHIADGKFG
ncbi:MAG: hypothetical protein ABR962_07100 [Candidatus Bathyarchaeia archaeon]|jgi:hypothetical protein